MEQLLDPNDDEFNGDAERRAAEAWALSVVRTKIGHNYDLDFEITPTLPFSMQRSYGAGDRCIIDFPEWVKGKAYVWNDLVIYEGVGYIALTDSQSNTFDESTWQSIGNRYDIYYIPFPYPVFSSSIILERGGVKDGMYSYGDNVWWNGKIWSNLVPTGAISREEAIQYQTYSEIPRVNTFPGSIGADGYWKEIETYSVSGEAPVLSEVWVQGDNRDPLMVRTVVDLALYKLHERISANNVPENRINNRDMAFEWLNSLRNGKEVAEIPVIQPSDIGDSISWGSKPKQRNSY